MRVLPRPVHVRHPAVSGRELRLLSPLISLEGSQKLSTSSYLCSKAKYLSKLRLFISYGVGTEIGCE